MMYRAEFGGVGERVWSTNALTFETRNEAEAYADNLLCRWTGADIARVVDNDVPKHETVDPNDERIVASYRSDT